MKKELYKITAYHCPSCGGVTEPKKKFCDWCGRELDLRRDGKYNHRVRLLVSNENDNYIYWDDMYDIKIHSETPYYEPYIDANGRYHMITRPIYHKFSIIIPWTDRGKEILNFDFGNRERKVKTRVEILGDYGIGEAYECTSYVCDAEITHYSEKIQMGNVNIIEYGYDGRYLNTAIPQKIVDEMRCPNCGAPIKSRYGACDYCSGWSAVEW